MLREFFSQYGWPHNLRLRTPPLVAILQFLIMLCIFAFYFLATFGMNSDCVHPYYVEVGYNTYIF
jgi:hypothetical protein